MTPLALSNEFNSPVLFKEEIAECNNSEELLNVVNTFDNYNNKWKIGTDNAKYTRLTKKDVWGNVHLIVYKNK